jgi:protein ImuB
LRVGLLQPVTNTDYLLDLARIRFADIRFIAPVISIALQTDLTSISLESGKDLFGPRPDHAAGALELVEQLRTRLGTRAVHGIRAVPEHRPEAAWEAVTLADKDLDDYGAAGEKMARPLWMLTEPLALEMVAGEPVFPDALDFESGPERIETGWWDGGDIRRDYYIARNCHGVRLWIFRDCRDSCWHLHGFFG